MPDEAGHIDDLAIDVLSSPDIDRRATLPGVRTVQLARSVGGLGQAPPRDVRAPRLSVGAALSR
jgi:hypothetical protein